MRSSVNFYRSSHAQIDHMQKHTSVFPVSPLVQTYLHATSQRFVLQASLCHYNTVPIWPLPSHLFKLLHVLPTHNHLQGDALPINHPLLTLKFVHWSCLFLQAKFLFVHCLERTYYPRGSFWTDILKCVFGGWKKALEYLQCKYTQWCTTREVLGNNALKIVS